VNKLLTYIVDWIKSYEKGNTTTFSDPAPPSDLGDPLTQDEIDFVKRLKKEMDERFNPPVLP
jgi:hypothetical protein